MSAQVKPLGGAGDKYAKVRETTVAMVQALADAVQAQNDARLNCLPKPMRDMVIAEHDPIRVATWYAREAAHTLSEFNPADGLALMFGCLENTAMSTCNLLMMLRCMEAEP